MLVRQIYYEVKPFLPRRIRFTLRRLLAIRKREASRHVWPINPAAGQTPADWPGWPEQKKFAFVLTHDVEGPEGVAKCRQLAELEMSLGFRSSFNFIPEGDYQVSASLRSWLTDNGFEVGVHDLHHDGKLYSSRQGFSDKARKINGYLKEWGAGGYRSGFMFHNLDWHHDINAEYDASTFDTDPFEPQPEGVGTIFPFWVPRPGPGGGATRDLSGAGYVELPYTLAQDSTLYLLFREKTSKTWIDKMHWVAGQGGMALVNVHPDYVQFPGEKSSVNLFSADRYADLLREVAGKYAGKYWNPTPRTLARWYRTATRRPASPTRGSAPPVYAGLKGKRAAVLLYSVFPGDPRPRRAAEALAECGMQVDVLCQTHQPDAPTHEIVGGIDVRRLPISRRRDGKLLYLWQYSLFFVSAFWFLIWRGTRRKYDVIHVHNMPDFLVFAAIIPRLRGAKVMLDLHDPMPELMTTIFGGGAKTRGVRLLEIVEKWSTGFANAVITVNTACRRIFSSRSCAAEKISVIMNAPDEQIFAEREPIIRPRADGAPFIIMYHGSIVDRHGLDLAVTALATVRQTVPGAVLRIYGARTPFLDKVLASVKGTEMESAVQYLGGRSLEQIAVAIREADVGVIPNKRSIFTEINTPTRIFEYLSQGLPVVAPRSPGILDYFGSNDLVYFDLGNAEELAQKLLFVYREPAAVRTIIERGQAIYRDHRWSAERERFLNLVSGLLGVREPAPVNPQPAPAGARGGP